MKKINGRKWSNDEKEEELILESDFNSGVEIKENIYMVKEKKIASVGDRNVRQTQKDNVYGRRLKNEEGTFQMETYIER